MNSSISSSEPRRFIRDFCVAALAFGCLVYVALVLLDPFMTGRFGVMRWARTYDIGPRTANVLRLRDPDFTAAIIGNSTIQLLNPERLNALSGERFVQLSTPGTGPMEQVVLIEALLRQPGSAIQTLVLGLDPSWCDPARISSTKNPFPFWLYDTSPLAYLRNLFRANSIEAVFRRIRLQGSKGQQARRDGYWDYETPEYKAARRGPIVIPEIVPSPTGETSAVRALQRLLEILPASMRLVLVHPPVFVPDPPQASPTGIAAKQICKVELAQAALRRPRTVLLDRWVDDDLTRQSGMFYDGQHYRGAFALVLENDLAKLLKRPNPP